MYRKIIPDIINEHPVRTLKGSCSALDAAKDMLLADIAAIVIVDDKGAMTGIVTERDLTRRVIAKGLDPKIVALDTIMTKNPETLKPADTASDALQMMRSHSFRHLPVVRDGTVIGMVSIRDLYSAVKKDLEDEIRETEAYVFGDRYSV